MSKELISNIVETILNGYDTYISDFKQITLRIPENFKNRDWQQLHANHRERLRLYKDQLKAIITTCKALLNEKADNKEVWAKIRESYFHAIASNEDRELAGTFFNRFLEKYFREN